MGLSDDGYAAIWYLINIEGFPPKGPYLPWVSMAGSALLAAYHRHMQEYQNKGNALKIFAIGSRQEVWVYHKYLR